MVKLIHAVAPAAVVARFRSGVAARRDEWSLERAGGRARVLDVVNHVLRVAIQAGLTAEFAGEFEALAAFQGPEGGWGDTAPARRESGVRNTSFAGRNLLRAGRALGRPALVEAAVRAAEFVLAKQEADGSWYDPVWGRRDATSSSMGLMIYALNEPAAAALHAAAAAALERAAAHLAATQSADGTWPDDQAYEAPVGPTSHLLPKLLLAGPAAAATARRAVDALLALQAADGSWDGGHVDHTCDATRALTLAAGLLDDPAVAESAARGVAWLVDRGGPNGAWGEGPGDPPSLLLACDVLDAFSKFHALGRGESLRRYWE